MERSAVKTRTREITGPTPHSVAIVSYSNSNCRLYAGHTAEARKTEVEHVCIGSRLAAPRSSLVHRRTVDHSTLRPDLERPE